MVQRLTKNFWRHEFQCRCQCGFDSMDWQTVEIVQKACDHYANKFGVPRVVCIVTSAARCLVHNKAVGSTDASQHPLGRALDIRILGVTPKELYDYFCAEYPDRFGFGLYTRLNFVHVDTRSGPPARWEIL